MEGPPGSTGCTTGCTFNMSNESEDQKETSDCESRMPATIGRVSMLSLEHPNRIDLYFVAGLVAIVAVSVFWLMRRK